jgi:nucleoside-diphosphate-sugar epimerase
VCTSTAHSDLAQNPGIDGFVHVASPLGGSDASTAISIAVRGGLNALKASAKTPSIKRFVFTSSIIAATFPKPGIEFVITESNFNEDAVEFAKDNPLAGGLGIYAALKTETEKAMWRYMNEYEPDFVFNSIVRHILASLKQDGINATQLPSANYGRVLIPEQQDFPSTIAWARQVWTGERLDELRKHIQPQWFISPLDTALLHVSALIYGDVASERLFGLAETFTFNQMLAIFRRLYPQRKFPEDTQDSGVDRMIVPNQRAEEVLRWVKGAGWDSLESSLKVMSEDWV